MKRKLLLRPLAVLLCMTMALAAFAQVVGGKRFSESFTNAPMPEVLKTIGKKSGVRVQFSYEDVSAYKVSVKLTNTTAEESVKKVIADKPLTYKVVEGKFIVVSKSKATASVSQQATFTVNGRVCDADRQPLPGVSVAIDGGKMLTTTDADGHFSVKVNNPDARQITFSFIGMKTQNVKLSGNRTKAMNIVMHEEGGFLDEVVVTGYQVLNKRSLTSAVTSAKMEDLARADMSSLDQMLEGKIPDLLVTNNSAEAGVAPKIRIRGTSTLVGNREPLWVVDGIVVKDPVAIAAEELNDPDYVNRIGNAIAGLNPQDIERIDVLKDAAATAIYGSKAANGVIVVTTKRGYEGKPKVSYTMNATLKLRPHYSDRSVDVMSSKERIQFSRELYQTHYQYPSNMTMVGYEGLLNQLYNGKIDYDGFVQGVSAAEAQNTDWFDLLTQNSLSTQNTVSVSGGSKRSRYYASLGYTKDDDVIKANDNDRYTFSMNIDNTFSRWLTASFTFNGYHSERDYYQDEIAPLQYAYQASRCIPAYQPDGQYAYYQKVQSDGYRYNYNILNELDNSGKKQVVNSMTFTTNLQFTFTDWLRANAILSLNTQNTDIEGWWGEKTAHISALRTAEYGERIVYNELTTCPQGGELSKSSIRDLNYTARFQIDANKYFGENERHNIDATFGIEISSDKYRSHYSVARGYFRDRGESFVTDIDPTKYPNYATWLTANQPQISDDLTNTFSTYLSLSYAYKRLWRVNINGRVDGSNKFGDRSNDKFLPIWSVSGSYDLSSFVSKATWIDYLTAKASFGFQGNMLDSESPTMTIRKGSMSDYYNEYLSSIVAHPNPDLKWEKTTSWNVGLDMSFFDHRLAIEASVYYKKTKDAFMSKRVSGVNGVTSYVINGGDVTNKGYSFDITATPIRTKDFRWTLSTSISKVINSVDTRPDAQTYDLEDFLNGTAVVEDKSVNTFYSYRFLGLSPVDGGPLFDDYVDSPDALRGLSKYDTYTMVLEASGKREADIQGSLTNTFRYKQWHASVSLGYSLGAKTRLFAMYGSAASGGAYGSDIYSEKNYSRDYMDRWQKPGDELTTNVPAIISKSDRAYFKYSRHWSDLYSREGVQTIANNYWDMYDYSNIRVVSADYLKLQSMSVTYELPQNLLNTWGLTRLALTLSAYNLFTICDSALKGQTPTQGGFSTIQLSDRPSFSFGLNLQF